jgi:Protein of unknown function (DUF1822)
VLKVLFTPTERPSFSLPITLKAHAIADQFRQQQPTVAQAKQVYLNTLAVQTVQYYLSLWGIATDLTASHSWHPALQALANTADLMVTGQGRLECRSLLPTATDCHIPPEVWSNRIGYVAVQFDAALQVATLLGFMPQVTTAIVPLAQWQSLDALLDCLPPCPRVASVPAAPRGESLAPTQLSQWLQGVVAIDWQPIADLLGPQPLAWSFRSGGSLQSVEPPMIRGNLLNLGIGLNIGLEAACVALLVSVGPVEQDLLEIWIRVCPVPPQTHLPPDLAVMIRDADDIVVMQAQSRHTDMIQLRFSGERGEMFSVKVTLGRQSVIKVFVI